MWCLMLYNITMYHYYTHSTLLVGNTLQTPWLISPACGGTGKDDKEHSIGSEDDTFTPK